MQQRIKSHLKDMTHAHLQESRIIPEMSVKPSALSQKRPVSNVDLNGCDESERLCLVLI